MLAQGKKNGAKVIENELNCVRKGHSMFAGRGHGLKKVMSNNISENKSNIKAVTVFFACLSKMSW